MGILKNLVKRLGGNAAVVGLAPRASNVRDGRSLESWPSPPLASPGSRHPALDDPYVQQMLATFANWSHPAYRSAALRVRSLPSRS
jgi:hypothetical protein